MKKNKQKDKKAFAIHSVNSNMDWKQYLDELHIYLTGLGFKKYNQKLKSEDFAYWKNYGDKYQIGLLVYDYTKYTSNKVNIQFECMLNNVDGRCDFIVKKNIELPEFEKMAKTFYDAMVGYYY